MNALDRLHQDITNQERIRLVGSFSVAEIVSAPGHRRLRHPGVLGDMSRRIAGGDLGPIGDEPILLNVFTAVGPEGGVGISTVECVDGNHRLAAALHAGRWRTVRDIPRRLLEVWVNGWPAGGTGPGPRWIPLEVAEASGLDPDEWFRVPEDWGPKGPTAQIRGDISATDPAIAREHRGITIGELLRRNLGSRPPRGAGTRTAPPD
jgi:hypothetical protein